MKAAERRGDAEFAVGGQVHSGQRRMVGVPVHHEIQVYDRMANALLLMLR